MHHHNAGVPVGEKLALRSGVTTPLELEAGVYPVHDWYERLEGKCRTNYGASSGTIAVREATGSWGAEDPRCEIVLIGRRDGIDDDVLPRAFDACVGTGDDTDSPVLRLVRKLAPDLGDSNE